MQYIKRLPSESLDMGSQQTTQTDNFQTSELPKGHGISAPSKKLSRMVYKGLVRKAVGTSTLARHQQAIQRPSFQFMSPRGAHSRSNAHTVSKRGHRHPKGHSTEQPIRKPGPSSYWSVSELQKFDVCIARFGTDWKAMADHMGTKTHTMLCNQYNRIIEQGRSDLVETAQIADHRRALGNFEIDIPSFADSHDQQVPNVNRRPTTQPQNTQPTLQQKLAARPQPQQAVQPNARKNLRLSINKIADRNIDAAGNNAAPQAPAMVPTKSRAGINFSEEQILKMTPAQQQQMRAQLLKAQDASNAARNEALSPNALSPLGEMDSSSVSPYIASRSLNPSPRSPLSRPQHAAMTIGTSRSQRTLRNNHRQLISGTSKKRVNYTISKDCTKSYKVFCKTQFMALSGQSRHKSRGTSGHLA
jgi:hypothetical protein